jgi:hypothetical protein
MGFSYQTATARLLTLVVSPVAPFHAPAVLLVFLLYLVEMSFVESELEPVECITNCLPFHRVATVELVFNRQNLLPNCILNDPCCSMAPTTRNSAKGRPLAVDPSNLVDANQRKRQRGDDPNNLNEVNAAPSAATSAAKSQSSTSTPMAARTTNKNAHLKGRKRFSADLEDMKTSSTQGFIIHGLSIQRTWPC